MTRTSNVAAVSDARASESRIGKALASSAMVTERQRKLEPLDVEQLPIKVMFWRVLLEIYIPKYSGSIITPEQVDEAEKIASTTGRVLQLGHFAFQSRTSAGLHLAEEPNIPAVGDYVLHETYAGQEIKLRSGHALRVLNDTEILCWAKDPSEIKGYL